MPLHPMQVVRLSLKIITSFLPCRNYINVLMGLYFTRIKLFITFARHDLIWKKSPFPISIDLLLMVGLIFKFWFFSKFLKLIRIFQKLFGKLLKNFGKNQTYKKDLTSVFLPATNKFGAYSTMPLFSIISDLCAHPSYKLLACRSLPQFSQKSFQSYSIDLLTKYMHQLNHTGNFNEDQGNLNFKNCSNYAFARSVYHRGKSTCKFDLLNDNSQFSPFLDPRIGLKYFTFSSNFSK